MPTIFEWLARGETLISNGAKGTHLQGHGLEPGGCADAFKVSHAEVVQGMAREFSAQGLTVMAMMTLSDRAASSR